MGKIITDSNGKVLMDSNGGVYEATAAIDSNIVPNNIKKDVSILGVTGSLEVIEVDGMNGFLSVESKTIPTSASATTNITYNKNCGILDENYKKWDTLDWHQRWVDNGYSAEGLSKPIGIWMNALELQNVYLWQTKVTAGYTDLSGSQSLAYSTFTGFLYYNEVVTSAMTLPAAWPASVSGNISHGTAGKYKSSSWRTKNNGDGLDYEVDNTGEVFTIPVRSGLASSALRVSDSEKFLRYNYAKCEVYKAAAAICSGISTTQPNGTKTTVEILNSNGQQPAVGEDMYFWIGGTNTTLLAKYNLACYTYNQGRSIGQRVTQTLVDAIYAKQIAAGINMNDTGVNSESKPVLIEGMNGAEAVAVDGYWYIKTPYISNTNATGWTGAQYNIPDDRLTYLCLHRNVRPVTEMELLPYWFNKSTHITTLFNLLRTIEGMSDDVPAMYEGTVWTGVNYNVQTMWFFNLASGVITTTQTYNKNAVITCPLSTQQYT